MATATIDTKTEQPTLRDRTADAVRQVADIAREAQTVAKGAFTEKMLDAKKTMADRVKDLEALRDTTAERVQKAPLTSMGVALGAGVLLGVAFGWFMGRTPAKAPDAHA